MFIAYLGVLWLGRVGHVGWYRIGMVPALVLFGIGGVIANVTRFLDSGLENYASTGAWAVAVAINGYGTVLNTIAALGLFSQSASSGETLK